MPDILHRIGIAAPPERVFAALASLDGLRGWWVAGAKGDADAGGVIDFGFCRMRVIELDADQLVRWHCLEGPPEWVSTEVSFALEWKDGQTFVMFRHADWDSPVEFMYHCSTKWATFLLSLRDWVEGREAHPVPNDIKIHVGD
ncbi:MAG TPA: SRPBCC domain-containing protein [Burkholderiaceae bacterium]